MRKSTNSDMSEKSLEPEWTKEEDDLLLSLLYRSRSGARSETRRSWKDIAVDMNTEALRLRMKTRFFHHQKVRSRWWSRFGQFYAVGTPEEAEPPSAPDTATDLAPLQDSLARMGTGSLHGTLPSQLAWRSFQLPRAAFLVQDVNSQTAGILLTHTTSEVIRPALHVQIAATEHGGPSKAKAVDDNRNRDSILNNSAKGELGDNTKGNSKLVAFVDGKGKSVARHPRNSWIF